jgi:hypothetical protein
MGVHPRIIVLFLPFGTSYDVIFHRGEVQRIKNITATEETREGAGVSYVYYVHGIVPEFMPRVAFRREKHFKTEGQKIIKCPYCKKTFITVGVADKIELYQHSRKAKVTYHETMSCKSCHRLVGIIYAGAKSA